MRRGFADTLNRLATASGTGWAESYTYDGFGNLTDKTPTAGSPPVLHVAVNAANNQLVGYAYDVNGKAAQMSGTLLHEILHLSNFQLSDATIAKMLGVKITATNDSAISLKLTKDCFPTK